MADGFLHELSRPRPDPGGGAAAAFGARLGMALLLKVVRLEELRTPGPDPWPGRRQAGETLEQVLEELQEADVRAYAGLAANFRQAGSAREAAALKATRIPYRIAQTAAAGLTLAAQVGGECARHLLADVQVAAELLAGSVRGAAAIARANLPWLGPAASREWAGKLDDLVGRMDQALLQTRKTLQARMEGGPS
ncbi:MAG: cyclodeaminase/cyclohydrolase family protein [Syntrophobacterales bacterium]|nr:cyclodeaminase/cyclohydrolase family protein [Syntrophobacterales bacterium]